MTPTDTREIVTTIVAAIALILSIINFIIDRKDKTAKLKVNLANGTIKTGRRKDPYDNGYFIEIVNNGKTRVVVTEVVICFLQENKSVADATATKIDIKTTDEVINFGIAPKDQYTFLSTVKMASERKSVLLDGENVFYWLSDAQSKLLMEGNLPFDVFDIKEDIKIKAKVRIALGNQYYSNTINISPSKNKNKKRRNS